MHWNVIDYNKFLNIVFMHLNKQNLIVILAAFSLFSSCVYHFDLDEISEIPKLTVYSYPGSGDTTVVRLSHSLPVHDKGRKMYGLKGRDIRLEVNDIAVPLWWTEDSLPGVPAKSYYVVRPYEMGDCVRLTALVEGVKTVSAFTVIPASFPLNAVRIERKPSKLNVLQLQINFTDYAKTENYYAVTVKERVKYWKEGTSEVHYGESSSAYMDWSDEPILDASSGLDDIFMGNYAYYQNLYFWSDEKIQGKNYTLRLNMTYIPDYKTSIQNETFINRKQYKVYLYSLSEEFYRYLKSLNAQKNNELGNVELAPMRATYTNVENGFGLVGGCRLRQTEWMDMSVSETRGGCLKIENRDRVTYNL